VSQLSTRALIDVDYVKTYANVDVDDQSRDDLIIELINAASASIHQLAGREFKPVGTNPQTRMFDSLRGLAYTEREFSVGDVATVTAVTCNGVALASSDWVAIPRVREEWEPITTLRVTASNYTLPTNLYSHYDTFAVTGSFGFPAVPENIKQACRVTVMVWLERDIKHFSETFRVDEQIVQLPRVLPRQVYDDVIRYTNVALVV
jgi:hypothetical protein